MRASNICWSQEHNHCNNATPRKEKIKRPSASGAALISIRRLTDSSGHTPSRSGLNFTVEPVAFQQCDIGENDRHK